MFVESETGKSDILANIEKCRARSGTIAFFFVTSELHDAWSTHLASLASAVAITPTDLERLDKALP